jgi:iron complex outermembrane receptor protein
MSIETSLKSRLVCAVSSLPVLAFLLLPQPALAQTAGSDPAQPGTATTATVQATQETPAQSSDIVVTGSRIDRAGFQAPTPLTVIGDVELRQAGRTDVGAVLDDLPEFRASVNPANTTNDNTSGSSGVDLRGLGTVRTLVLLDGHRFVGDADLNSIPFDLVKRVDVVTGGASAAWGSGAVSGVVNISLNDKYQGFSLTAQNGISTYGDGPEHRFDGTAGTSFAGGRGHFVLSAEYVDDEGVDSRLARKNVAEYNLISNPFYTPTNGQHQLLIAPDVRLADASTGGLIVSGPLTGMTFNPDGTLRPFQYGVLSGTNMIGGEGPSNDTTTRLTSPAKRLNLYGNASYDVTPSIHLYANVRYARVRSDQQFFPDSDYNPLTISVDNAFLPAAVRSVLVADGQSSFQLGRFNTDFGNIALRTTRTDIQGTIGAKGEIGDNYRWDAYYSHGTEIIHAAYPGLKLAANYAASVDSIISPTTGQPICRVALSDPSTSCVPINLFGEGSPSLSALDYILGTGSRRTENTLDVGGVSLRGEPFVLPAGKVSIAVGGEARRESSTTTVDPLSAAGAFSLLNLAPLTGSFTVKEGFAEILAPLVKDAPLLHNLNLNAAARISDYSTSGSIWSWKVGLTDELFHGVKLRGVRSRDIRSANVDELFSAANLATTNVYDPVRNSTYLVNALTGGNPALKPEKADTWSGGVVLEPDFARGLSLSLDYYSIKVAGAIAATSAQDIVTKCADGLASACGQITRDASGIITEVRSTNQNFNVIKTSGVDAELNYRVPVTIAKGSPGTLRFRGLVTYVQHLIYDDGTLRYDAVGDLGATIAFGLPRWRAVADFGYDLGGISADVRARYVGGGDYDKREDIQNNKIASRTYIDLSLQDEIATGRGHQSIKVYGSIANLFNRAPPIAPNSAFYDVIGRYFTIGAKVSF